MVSASPARSPVLTRVSAMSRVNAIATYGVWRRSCTRPRTFGTMPSLDIP